MLGFPKDLEPVYFDQQYRKNPELWREPFLALWREHGPPTQRNAAFHPFADGTNLIAAMGEAWVFKVFPPELRHQWESERRVMQHLNGQLDLPIPSFYRAGEDAGGWTYLVMSRLPGVSLEKIWPQLGPADRISILHDIGAIMARVHTVPIVDLLDLPPLWSGFLLQQIEGCRGRHQRLGMPAWFVDQVDAFVQESLSLIPESFPRVLLTGEYTPFNLLVEDRPSVQKIAGMIDFGDAMIGFHQYDLLGPLLFSCEGQPAMIHALLEGYGFAANQRDRTLRRRLFVLQILHRYSDFFAQLRIPDWSRRAQSLEQLENLIWPIGNTIAR